VSDRQAIVDALAEVPELTPYQTTPATLAAFAAWPEWRSTRWMNQVPQGARQVGWFVLVALPGTWDVTTLEADPLVEVIGQALADADIGVELVEPFNLRVTEGGATIPVLRFTVGDR
jgi:hypothetical protein